MKITSYMTLALLGMAVLAGCDGAARQSSQPVPAPAANNASRYAGAGDNLTPVESALILSEKYATLAVDMERTIAENRTLMRENGELKEQLTTVRTHLDQATKELKDANELLVDMRIELNNWRNNVLGFRDEMILAQQAQLEALLKIMVLLGGEVPPQQ